MRYFTKDLSRRMNSCEESVRKQAENEWSQNTKKYEEDFQKVKRHIPQSFLKEYMQRQEFHDCYIEKIDFSRKRGTYRCDIYLYDGLESFCLTLLDVKQIKVNVLSFENCVVGKLAWVYSEFEWTNNKTLVLSVDCGPENEMQIEFKTIKLSMIH